MNGTYKIIGIDRQPGEIEPDGLRLGQIVTISQLKAGLRAHVTAGNNFTVTRPVTDIARIFDDLLLVRTEKTVFNFRKVAE